MRLTWRARLEQQPQLRQFDNWPTITLDCVPQKKRKQFTRNVQVVDAVLSAQPIIAVAKAHGLSPGRISQLLDRALGGECSEPPSLTRGLIPNRPIQQKRRRTSLNKTKGRSPGACSCAFRALLEAVPGLRDGLDAMITAKLKDTAYAQRLTPQAFHGEFKRLLAEAHWPQNRYPYTTDSLAYQSVRRHLHQRTAELQQVRQARVKPARDLGIDVSRSRALRAIQIDEHTLDLRKRVHLRLNGEMIPLQLARASVLIALDVDTECVLGYHLAPTRYPNQQDMLTLLTRCLEPWQPRPLHTPGLSYLPGACFPSGLPLGFPISFGTVQLDNALLHRANSVIEVLCHGYGATLSYGPPGIPKVRAHIEAVFDYIERNCGHRHAATTGSYPTDPEKESRKNAKRPPAITFQSLDEALSVILTEYNVTPNAALGGATPLALFEHHCRHHYVRYVPPDAAQQWRPFCESKVVPLHWYRHEKRVPHINFMYARYDGPGLVHAVTGDEQVRVVFDRRDIRTLHAYSLQGDDLGELQVSRSWRRFPHSLATRQWIHKHTREYQFSTRDPLSDYFRLLLEGKGKPKAALSLLRVYTEYTQGQASLSLGTEIQEETDTDIANRPATENPWQWRVDNAKRRS